jgi:2-polyprenyl-3-methyl-5-hydroxy-6-metoxy-1,4-benzoquinol methylase
MQQQDFLKQKCMLCGAEGLTFVNNLRDDDIHFAVECTVCGHVQISPLPTVEEDNEFYQRNEMGRRLIPKSLLDDRQMMLKYEIWGDVQKDIVATKFPDKSLNILEIGSGYGWFVNKMRSLGYDIDGIELSDEKRAMAKEYLNVELLSINLLSNKLPANIVEKYDVVCMFYVLEHIIDLHLFLKESLRVLKPNGKLVVIVPNFFDKMKELSSEYEKFQYFRAHLSYFKPKTLTHLLSLSGLKNIQIEGTQLYSMENAIYWLRNGKPFLEKSQIEMPIGLEWIGEYYKRTLEQQLVSDGLLAIGTK